jgi:type I restriction enzyme M protein
MENKILTQQELESHLWGAADILRGAIDAADYKHYIFGLLFYKRLSDVWEEEYEERLAEFEDEELAKDPEEHRFHIPEGCFWSDVKKKTTNIGEALNASFRAIEDSNKRLKDVFQDVDFNNKKRFPDSTLELLLQHFDKYSLKKKFVAADVLGNAYEYLIAKFADDAGTRGGEFYTPKEVVRLIVDCLRPSEGMSVYDPTCGSGGMLLEAFHFMERNNKNPKTLRLYGQEKNLNTWAISQMNLFLHDIDDAFVIRGDTISEPKHLESEGSKKIKKFDLVLANPPFSLKNWGYDFWKSGDTYGRDILGCPPKGYGDYAFVQHMLSSIKDSGKVGVVVPLGVLFRSGVEKKIRKELIDNYDWLEAIIGLPPKLFYGAGIPAAVLIFNKAKEASRKDRVIFINADQSFEEGTNQNRLRDDDISRIVDAFVNYKEESRFSSIVSREDIVESGYNLNVKTYADNSPPLENFDVQGILYGGVPKYEIEDEYNTELLEGVDLSNIFKNLTDEYLQFVPTITTKEYFHREFKNLSEEGVGLLEKWWMKYSEGLTSIVEKLNEPENNIKSILKEFNYD